MISILLSARNAVVPQSRKCHVIGIESHLGPDIKRLAGNEIELGMMIPMIESRASNIPMTKGTMYVVMRFDR